MNEFITQALGELLNDDADLITSNAWEFMLGTLNEKELADLKKLDREHLAKHVTLAVLVSDDLKEAVEKLAKQLIDSLHEAQL